MKNFLSTYKAPLIRFAILLAISLSMMVFKVEINPFVIIVLTIFYAVLGVMLMLKANSLKNIGVKNPTYLTEITKLNVKVWISAGLPIWTAFMLSVFEPVTNLSIVVLLSLYIFYFIVNMIATNKLKEALI